MDSLPVQLFLIRHAEALQTNHPTGDNARPLTEAGRKDSRRLALACNLLGISFDYIWSSPLRRADETASILNDALIHKPGVVFEESLGVPGNFNGLRKALRATASDARIALVGHMPFLGECLQYWVGGIAHPGIHLGTSSLVCLSGHGFNCGEMLLSYVLNKELTQSIASIRTD